MALETNAFIAGDERVENVVWRSPSTCSQSHQQVLTLATSRDVLGSALGHNRELHEGQHALENNNKKDEWKRSNKDSGREATRIVEEKPQG